MEAYFVRDSDPTSGALSIYREKPDIKAQRFTVVEVRKGEFDAEIWLKIMLAEVEVDPSTFIDPIIQPYFDQAAVFWTREGGYVNGTE